MELADQSRERLLDGLRGWASVFVLLDHTFTFFLLKGSFATSAYIWLAQGGFVGSLKFGLFFVSIVIYRFIGNGSLPVYVFFVLSGYVLTIGYVRTGRIRLVYGQAVRRYPRLALPIFSVCFVAYFLMRAGFMFNLHASEIFDGSDWIGTFYNFKPTILGVLKFSLFDVFLHYKPALSYDFVLWTMNIEFVGSFLVLVMAVIGHGHRWRWAFYAAVAVVFAGIASPLASFCIGLMMSEFSCCHGLNRVIRCRTLPLGIVVALILIVISPMIVQRLDLFYEPLLNSVFAGILLFCMLFSPFLRSLLSSRISILLGRLSFPLYLVHPVMICSLGSLCAWRMAGSVSHFTLIAITACVCIMSSFAAAYLFLPVELTAIQLARRFSHFVIDRPRQHLSALPLGKEADTS